MFKVVIRIGTIETTYLVAAHSAKHAKDAVLARHSHPRGCTIGCSRVVPEESEPFLLYEFDRGDL